jgi:hypothetical protein
MNPLLAVSINPPTGNGKSFSDLFGNGPGSLIGSLLQTSLTVAGIIFLCLLIFGGFTLIMNAGDNDPKKAALAKTVITDAIIGFLVVILAYFIIQVIEVVTGFSILNPTI